MSSGPVCPFCGSGKIDAEFVDIGVGYQQVTPYVCDACMAQQMNPYQDNSQATDEERRVGWRKGPVCLSCLDSGEMWVWTDATHGEHRPCIACPASRTDQANPYVADPDARFLSAIRAGLTTLPKRRDNDRHG